MKVNVKISAPAGIASVLSDPKYPSGIVTEFIGPLSSARHFFLTRMNRTIFLEYFLRNFIYGQRTMILQIILN